MHQDSEPAPPANAPTTAVTTHTGPTSPTPGPATQPAATPGPTSILRTSSPPPRVGSPARDPANSSTEGPSRVRSIAGHPDHFSAQQDVRRSPLQRRSTFTDRGPYDVVHDASGTGSQGLGISAPLPALPVEARRGPELRSSPTRRASGLDWIVPQTTSEKVYDKAAYERSIGDRLDPTLATAKRERDKFARKAQLTGWTLNVAIGLQVLLGALTTGLSAASTSARQTSVSTAILGGLSTLVASYLARARGSNEPQLSTVRVKDLEQFIRECEAFKMDSGHMVTHDLDKKIEGFRQRLEELLGNLNQERRLAPLTV